MRVVHHEHGVVLAAELHEIRERGDRALHREDAIGDDQPDPPVPGGDQLLLEVVEVGVLVYGGLTLGDGLGQANRVDDGRMVELIADHDVVFAQQSARHRLVRVPAAHEAERGRGADQSRAGGFQLAVNRERSADESDDAVPAP